MLTLYVRNELPALSGWEAPRQGPALTTFVQEASAAVISSLPSKQWERLAEGLRSAVSLGLGLTPHRG